MSYSQPNQNQGQGQGQGYRHGSDNHDGVQRGKGPHRHPEFTGPARRGYDHRDLYEPLPLRDYPDPPPVQQQPFSYGPQPHLSNYSVEASAFPRSEIVHRERFAAEGEIYAEGQDARRPDGNASEGSADSRDGKVRQKKNGSKKRPLTASRMFYRDERSKLFANPALNREESTQTSDVSSRTEISPRSKRKKFSQDREIDVDARWKHLGYSERAVDAEQAKAESKLSADGAADCCIQDFLRESAGSVNYEPVGSARSERHHEAKYGFESEMATPLVLGRGPPAGPPSLPSFQGRPEGWPRSHQMSHSQNPLQEVQHHDLPPQAPYPTQAQQTHQQTYTELAHHQSAMQFGDVPGNAEGGEAAPRDRLEMPPSRTVVVHDANGIPRRYELMYAALSMPYEMAREYMSSLSSTTNQLLDGGPRIQMASSAPGEPRYDPSHCQPPAYQAPSRHDHPRNDIFRDPPHVNFHSGN